MTVVIFGIIGVVLAGGPLDKMWVMINSFQVLFLAVLIDMEIVPEANLALTVLDFANMDNPITVKITESIIDPVHFEDDEVNNRYSAIGFTNKDILNNQAELFPILILTILIVILMGLLKLASTPIKRRCLGKFIDKQWVGLTFNYFIRLGIELYLILVITTSISLFLNFKFDTTANLFSTSLALFYFIFVQAVFACTTF